MKLLIVDDNTYVVAGIRVQLDWQALGITEVYGAYSVKEAFRILEKEKIDFLLTDIEMPEEDGFRLIDRIRERGMKTRVVLLTSFVRPCVRVSSQTDHRRKAAGGLYGADGRGAAGSPGRPAARDRKRLAAGAHGQ